MLSSPYHDDVEDELTLLLEARAAAASGRGRRLREAAGLTQGELAGLIGIDPSCVSRWEAGLRRPRGGWALRYARALRVLGNPPKEFSGKSAREATAPPGRGGETPSRVAHPT